MLTHYLIVYLPLATTIVANSSLFYKNIWQMTKITSPLSTMPFRDSYIIVVIENLRTKLGCTRRDYGRFPWHCRGIAISSLYMAGGGYILLSCCIHNSNGHDGEDIIKERGMVQSEALVNLHKRQARTRCIQGKIQGDREKLRAIWYFLPLVVYSCYILHNILFADKDGTVYWILINCHFSPINDNNFSPRKCKNIF